VRGRWRGLEVLEARLCFSNVPFEPAFGSPIPVGEEPNSTAVADFNDDGNLDLATVNGIDNDVSILLGDGTGAFTAAGDYKVGAVSVAVGDFNGDGNLDLATASFLGQKVSILLGDGTGAFSAGDSFGAGGHPTSIAVGDFDADGNLDLATTIDELVSGEVSIRLGDGTGAFTFAGAHGVGLGPTSVVVGDFNGDGNLDLATANSDIQSVSILSGDGTGEFTAAGAHGVGNAPVEVEVGDFNTDGNLDLATVNAFSDDVSILLGDGTGAFTAAAAHGVGDNPNGVAVGDFNVDGNLDLATANSGNGDVSILLGDGTGAFGAAGAHDVGDTPVEVAVGDFNRDGSLDLATANLDSDDISILLNRLVQISINDVALIEGDSGTNNLVFSVSLSQSSDTTITLDFVTLNATATAGIDYQNTFGTISFAPGQTSRFIVVPVNGDKKPESDETFTLLIGNASEGVIVRNTAIGTILNDDGGGGKGGGKKSAALVSSTGTTSGLTRDDNNAVQPDSLRLVPRSGQRTPTDEDPSIELLAESIVNEQEALSPSLNTATRSNAQTQRERESLWAVW
jgi:hypothetical protein